MTKQFLATEDGEFNGNDQGEPKLYAETDLLKRRIKILDEALSSIQRENDRYTAALERIMGGPMDADAWYRREARRALAGQHPKPTSKGEK